VEENDSLAEKPHLKTSHGRYLYDLQPGNERLTDALTLN
jgi:hypothetical protein